MTYSPGSPPPGYEGPARRPRRSRRSQLLPIAFGVGICLLVLAIVAAIVGAVHSVTKADPPRPVATTSHAPKKATSTKGVHPFDTTVTYPDGSTLRAKAPQAYHPGDEALNEPKYPDAVRITLTYTNHSNSDVDLGLATDVLRSGDQEGDPIFGLGNEVPDLVLPPGQSASWTLAYAVPNPDQLRLSVNIGGPDDRNVVFSTK